MILELAGVALTSEQAVEFSMRMSLYGEAFIKVIPTTGKEGPRIQFVDSLDVIHEDTGSQLNATSTIGCVIRGRDEDRTDWVYEVIRAKSGIEGPNG